MALEEARRAGSEGEVPVGAVVVRGGRVIGRGRNDRERTRDPMGHAEMRALREAAWALDGWRLVGTTLYVTLEPCLMCMGASLLARVERIVYAAEDPKAGAAGSLFDVSNDARLNHRIEVVGGILREDAADMLASFFRALRRRRKEARQARGAGGAVGDTPAAFGDGLGPA